MTTTLYVASATKLKSPLFISAQLVLPFTPTDGFITSSWIPSYTTLLKTSLPLLPSTTISLTPSLAQQPPIQLPMQSALFSAKHKIVPGSSDSSPQELPTKRTRRPHNWKRHLVIPLNTVRTEDHQQKRRK